MKDFFKSLLPKKLQERVAQNFAVSKIKPRLSLNLKGIRRLKYILIILAILGYYPTLNLPPKVSGSSVLAAEQLAEVSANSLPYSFTLPHPGYLSTPFSYYHPGIDIATGLGMPIRPIAPGEVIVTDYGFFGLGHEVIVAHPGGFQSTYGHMGRIFTKKGSQVTAATILGEVGLTGQTSGPHTHLEITKDGRYVDPQTVLPAIPPFSSPSDFKPVGGSTQSEPPESDKLHKTLKPDFS